MDAAVPATTLGNTDIVNQNKKGKAGEVSLCGEPLGGGLSRGHWSDSVTEQPWSLGCK